MARTLSGSCSSSRWPHLHSKRPLSLAQKVSTAEKTVLVLVWNSLPVATLSFGAANMRVTGTRKAAKAPYSTGKASPSWAVCEADSWIVAFLVQPLLHF